MKWRRKLETTEQEKLIMDRLIQKSKDAFIFAIEVINKPTLRHRSENFTFNICNAWELLLKAQLVKEYGENKVYYKNNKDRTINFATCVNFIFTDFNNPIKRNLGIIIKLRNKSTHFITPEYDDLYASVFQANVIYYVDHIKKVFNVDMNVELPSNFLTIAANPKAISDVRMLSNMDKATFNSFLKERKALQQLESEDGVTVSFEVRMKAVKKNPDLTFKIDPNAELSTQVIKQVMDPNNTHPYRQKDIISLINKEFGENTINRYSFRAIQQFEDLEGSEELFYYHQQSNSKTYSEKALNIIRKNIKENPHYLEIVIAEFKKKEKSNPRS